jgi:DNA-binding XRE family transcriptional regulator
VKKKSYSLRRLRSLLKFRQEDLANMVNIERSTYSKIEKDPWRCSLQLMDDIACQLDAVRDSEEPLENHSALR